MSDLLLVDGFYATPQRFLWHAASATAIVADLHLGIEASLNKQGIGIPEMNLRGMQDAWRHLIERLAAARTEEVVPRLIIAGDLFDSPTPGEEALLEARNLFAAIPDGIVVTLIVGNHDPGKEELHRHFPDSRFEIADHAVVGGYTVMHGDRADVAQGKGEGHWVGAGNDRRWVARGVIVGHQHPCVVLADRVQSAKMICFAVGKLAGRGKSTLISLPTFSHMPLGSSLLNERHWILDLPRPHNDEIFIAGIVEREESSRVLLFGNLTGLHRDS